MRYDTHSVMMMMTCRLNRWSKKTTSILPTLQSRVSAVLKRILWYPLLFDHFSHTTSSEISLRNHPHLPLIPYTMCFTPLYFTFSLHVVDEGDLLPINLLPFNGKTTHDPRGAFVLRPDHRLAHPIARASDILLAQTSTPPRNINHVFLNGPDPLVQACSLLSGVHEWPYIREIDILSELIIQKNPQPNIALPRPEGDSADILNDGLETNQIHLLNYFTSEAVQWNRGQGQNPFYMRKRLSSGETFQRYNIISSLTEKRKKSGSLNFGGGYGIPKVGSKGRTRRPREEI